jgi:hypothetical protein
MSGSAGMALSMQRSTCMVGTSRCVLLPCRSLQGRWRQALWVPADPTASESSKRREVEQPGQRYDTTRACLCVTAIGYGGSATGLASASTFPEQRSRASAGQRRHGGRDPCITLTLRPRSPPAERLCVSVNDADVRPDAQGMQGAGEWGESSGQPHAPSATPRVDGCARGDRRRAAHGHLPRQAHRVRDGAAVPRLGLPRRIAHGLPRLASVSSGVCSSPS